MNAALNKPIPRHRAIADSLRGAIQVGRYPVGSQLPTEEELTHEFGTSRPTVRSALATLALEGLIVRRTRVGSTVIASRPASVLVHQVDSIEELLAYPDDTHRVAIDSAFLKADPELSALLRCPAGSDWYCISLLRFAGDSPAPICWTDTYVLPQYAGVKRHAQHLRIPICNQIEELFEVQLDSARVEVFSGRVPARMAQALDTEADSPALFIVRRYRDVAGQVFEVSVSVHPERRYRMSFELRRELRPPRKPA